MTRRSLRESLSTKFGIDPIKINNSARFLKKLHGQLFLAILKERNWMIGSRPASSSTKKAKQRSSFFSLQAIMS